VRDSLRGVPAAKAGLFRLLCGTAEGVPYKDLLTPSGSTFPITNLLRVSLFGVRMSRVDLIRKTSVLILTVVALLRIAFSFRFVHFGHLNRTG